MKTSYNILWVDDEPNSVDTDIADVEEYLAEYGIDANIMFVGAPSDGSVKQQVDQYLDNPDLDILLVDYHMDGMNGDELVRMIRETDHVYLPVIFYSSSTVDELFSAVNQAQLDGVYIANRDRSGLINKVKAVVASLLKREQSVKQVRGLLMEGVSEIDAQFFEIFKKVWAKLDREQRESIATYLREIMDQRSASAKKTADEFPNNVEGFDTHILSKFLTKSYDTRTRWRLTSKVLELVGGSDAQRETLKEFDNVAPDSRSLNDLRNDYAHQTRKELDKDHSAERCVEIRKALRSQTANIEAILGSE